jgi:ATP-dependent DNA ligase
LPKRRRASTHRPRRIWRAEAATDAVGAAELIYFAFDPLFIDGASITEQPLVERKARLAQVLACAAGGDSV